jgi:hypothetical protein
MNLAAWNTPTVANAGATLVAISSGALGKDVQDLVTGAHPGTLALVAPFAGMLIGGFLAYVGRPSTIPPPSK